MKFIFAILAIFCLAAEQALAEDIELAREACSKLHSGVVVDRNDTGYYNNRCLLNCAINGRVWTHFLAEGEHCPQTGQGFCHSGACQPAIPTGYLDVQIESASVAGVTVASSSNLQVTACLQNQTSASAQTPPPLPLPADHSSCVSCATGVKAVIEGGFAYWNQVCSGISNGHLFNELATVTFEVWQTVGQFQSARHFIGGASVSVPEMAREHSSGRLLHLPLKGGHLAGQVNARVTWTPNE